MPFLSSLMGILETKPDVFVINGHGIYHPAFFGMASHFGVVFNVSSIGVAGRPVRVPDQERRGDEVFCSGRRIAAIIGGVHKELYVSVGHKVALDQALAIVKACIRGHRMPEPLFLADSLSSRVARGN
jgi:deoxyribonuclease V